MTNATASRFRHDRRLLEAIASRVRTEVIGGVSIRRTRIFLCGATAENRTSARERIAEELRKRGNWLEVHYPEHLFDELLTGPGHHDLLFLENLLAEGVDAIVIVLEGVGAFTELGAFANHHQLKKKLIVVQDRRYARDRSFIQLGPIRLLRSQDKSHVISMDLQETESIVRVLLDRLLFLKREPSPFKLDNLFHTQDFVLPLLYVLYPLSRAELVHALDFVTTMGLQRSEAIVAACLALLRAERLIVSTDLGLTLTRQGQDRVRRWGTNEPALDSLQLESLNRTRRYLRRRKGTT